MPKVATAGITREKLVEALNEDLSREYQAIIAYVNYSQVLKGAAYMNIADELVIHAKQELDHALQISNHVDYLGGMPSVTPKPVKTSKKAEDMLKFDLENEKVTIRNYRRRVKQADELDEFAIAESLRGILVQEQDHLIALATALGVGHPTQGLPRSRTALERARPIFRILTPFTGCLKDETDSTKPIKVVGKVA